ncbi:MAG: DUF5060 domain-containing protein [Ignavibacteriales bacterium]|nr:DUF5060 domain-containing protein [Ignavibacteriales bacterium]
MRQFAPVILFSSLLLCLLSLATAQSKVEQWDRFEVTLKHAYSGNCFKDVHLSTTFSGKDTSFVVAGFYDGKNIFRIRFMPQQIGTWTYTTSSNIPELDKKQGTFECIKATGKNHGMVNVSNTYNFKYGDGKQYYPFGTTAYAWIHMKEGVQELTLNTLKNSGFNKVRMCVLPKNYALVKQEPDIYPFPTKEVRQEPRGKETKMWDFDQFNPDFFQHLEKRIDDLSKLGIEADVIIFHPYDKGRWGFDSMPMEVNIRYVKYLTARLSSFRNVWWSIANEWDLVKTKTHDDWDLLSKAVVESDPYRHLCSIHGSTAKYYEYWKPEFTHISIQDEAPLENFGGAAILRNAYFKPIIYDEVGYEGNLPQRWGRYSGEQMLYLVWMGVIAGTYVTHGETYMFKDERDTIFWADGVALRGTSWQRIAFLRRIVEECPNPLQLADISRDHRTSTAGKGYYLVYFGKEVIDSWPFSLPGKNAGYERPKPGTRFNVEIIDTWNMTIQTYPLTFETAPENDYRVFDKDFRRVMLPLRPYVALRITEAIN